MAKLGYHVVVTGRVQGVCFRYSTAQQAKQLDILGHAINMPDGSVEVEMFGEQAQLQQLLDWLAQGPKHAIVDSLQVTTLIYQQKVRFFCA